MTTYAYDGEGRRVRKTTNGVSTVYVYAADGELMAEYGGTAQTAGTRYLTADHLGSVRLVTDGSGNVLRRHDYMPFGEEIPAGVGGRTTGMGYVANPAVTQKFTGKERDAETGLDYFGARYLSGVLGRWTGADVLLNSGRPWLPQSWNRYAYARNNPLRLVDPNGLYDLDNTCQADDAKCNKQFQQHAKDLKTQLAKLTQAVNKVKDPVEKARLQAGLKALGTEGDGNHVMVSFGATKGGGAAETDPIFDPATNTYSGFNVKFDPKKLTGSDAYGIAGVHEGIHIDDYQKYELNPATAMFPFQIEYRGYQTSAWAASALGYSSFTPEYNGKKFTIWNSSWGAVDDKVLTNFIKTFRDQSGQPSHPEVQPHNPLNN